MKNKIFKCLFMLVFLALPFFVRADELAVRLKGRILLQVEANGEAWYVNPENQERYYLGRPADAFQLMRALGLGVSNADFAKFNGVAPARLAGRILLKVEANGEAYYVNPLDLKMHYLGRPADAFEVMRALGLGVNNGNLEKIRIREGYGITNAEEKQPDEIESNDNSAPENTETIATTTAPIVEEPIVATSTEETTVSSATTCEFQTQYFKNINLSGWPVVSRTEVGIDNDWWTGKPEGFNYNNEFSVRWLGDCDFDAGKYKFRAVFNDGMRVYVDEELIIDDWNKKTDDATQEATINLVAGKHEIKVEYFENTGSARASLNWEKL